MLNGKFHANCFGLATVTLTNSFIYNRIFVDNIRSMVVKILTFLKENVGSQFYCNDPLNQFTFPTKAG